MSVLAVIPARSGSTRLKDKNLQCLGRHTLVDWAVQAARESRCDRILVSSDDPGIAQGHEWIERPADICGPDADIAAAAQDALLQAERGGHVRYDWIVTLQPTVPCRPVGMLDRMLDALVVEDALGAVTAIPAVPWMWRCRNDGSAANEWWPGAYPRSQDFELGGRWLAEINCISIARRDVVLAGRRWGLPLLLCALPIWANVDIDDRHDLEDARRRWPALEAWMREPIATLDYQRIDRIDRLRRAGDGAC